MWRSLRHCDPKYYIAAIMARIPLEDNFTDLIGKAQRGLRISDHDLAARAEVSVADLSAVKSGSRSMR